MKKDSKYIKFSNRYKEDKNNYKRERVQVKVGDVTSNLGTAKNHLKDIYQTLQPSKITIDHDFEKIETLRVFGNPGFKNDYPTTVSLKYQSPSTYDLQDIFPHSSYSFNFMSDRCLKTFIAPLPVKKIALTLDDLVDYSGLKKSLPNVSERLKKLHLRLTLEDVKYFTTFVDDVTSLSH